MVACADIETISLRTQDIIKNFAKSIEEIRKYIDLNPSEFIRLMLDKIGYIDALKKSKDSDIDTRFENIQEFINASVNFEQLNIGSNIEDFLENISLVSETDKYDEKILFNYAYDDSLIKRIRVSRCVYGWYGKWNFSK